MANDLQPLPRCCESHPTVEVLTEHLIAAFPQLGAATVTTTVLGARRAIEGIGLPTEDRVELVGLIARYTLMQQTGDITPAGRLKAEPWVGEPATGRHLRVAPES